MTIASRACLLSLIMALCACGGASQKPNARPLSPPPPTPQPEPALRSAPGRCQAIISRQLDAQRQALAALGVEPSADIIAALASRYDRRYLDACVALPEAALSCLEQASSALDGVASCKINAGIAREGRMQPSSIAHLVPWHPVSEQPGGDDASRDALAKALIGTWRDEAGEVWTFSADQGATHARAGKEPVSYVWSVINPDVIQLQSTTATQRRYVAIAGDAMTFASEPDAPQPPLIDDNARLRRGGLLALVEDITSETPRCAAFDLIGRRAARCEATHTTTPTGAQLTLTTRFDHNLTSGEPIVADTTQRFIIVQDRPMLARGLLRRE